MQHSEPKNETTSVSSEPEDEITSVSAELKIQEATLIHTVISFSDPVIEAETRRILDKPEGD